MAFPESGSGRESEAKGKKRDDCVVLETSSLPGFPRCAVPRRIGSLGHLSRAAGILATLQ